QKLYINGVEVFLTKKEILFLELFSQDLHHVASYDEIVNYVWEGEETNLTNIRAMIKRLRKKLPIDSIVIVKGIGYEINSFISFVIGTFIVIEFYSITGNAYTIRTGKELEDKDFLSFALLTMRDKVEETLKKKFKDKE
ncbi:helix-turn-helix domain-containing protein, partial [Brevundimonas sp. FT23028]|uniref:helix-turn-helix domain-containing protein n=1 Tax=Brevundimonas sp. FT23028 TaxID=3393748 RepID=UPI003B58A5B6